jgi:hypothetical protein
MFVAPALEFCENFEELLSGCLIYIRVYMLPMNGNIYIYKSETGWLGVFVCVLLGDGGLLPCNGGVFFLVSSRWYFLWGPFRGGIFFWVRSEVVFSLGSVPRWYFLWGPFRGGIFFGVRSKGIFLCLLVCLRVSKFCERDGYQGYAFSSVIHPSDAGHFRYYNIKWRAPVRAVSILNRVPRTPPVPFLTQDLPEPSARETEGT